MTVSEAEELAHRFHDTYERLAPQFNYDTRVESRVTWQDVPANNKALMVAVVMELFQVSQGNNFIAFRQGETSE